MSRHRNVRNLTEDDYYDDYDDYDHDDDYYYEEEEEKEEYCQQPQPQSYTPPAPAAAVTATAAAQAVRVLAPKQLSAVEKEMQLKGMGFTSDQAKMALEETKGNVNQAAEMLLNAANNKPPPGFLKPNTSRSTFTTATTPDTCITPTLATTTTTPTKPPTTTTTITNLTPNKVESTPNKPTVDYGPLPKLSPAIAAIIENQKSRLAMVVLGHVDAGKSTLMGQVLLQLDYVQKRTIAKYQKQAAELGKASFALAWVMDEDESERERGVTMELATKFISTPRHDLVILDAPGHADFIPSMISGAASADVGILVVAATRGEFEAGFHVGGGQTREHVVLARGLGVSQLIVAVNKLDAVDWNQERFLEIRSSLLPFLTSNGFVPKRICFVPISGLTGENVKTRSSELLVSWYSGPTLLDAIDSFVPAQRSVDKPLRAIIMDVYMEGKNVTAQCRVVQGIVQTGDKLVVLPIGDVAVVARMDHGNVNVSDENRLKFSMAGDTVNLIMSGIDVARVTSGCILSHAHVSLRPPVKKKMQAKVLVMEQLQVPIIRGAQVLLHMHSIDVPAVISKLIATTKRDGSIEKSNPRLVTGGASATVEITLQEKICLESFADCRALGRFVLRRGGDSIAIGIVEIVL